MNLSKEEIAVCVKNNIQMTRAEVMDAYSWVGVSERVLWNDLGVQDYYEGAKVIMALDWIDAVKDNGGYGNG